MFLHNAARTALEQAVRDGNEAKVLSTLDAMTDSNATSMLHHTRGGYGTLLHIAAECNQSRLIHVLISRKCSVDIVTASGLSALHCAASADVAEALLSHNADLTKRTHPAAATPLHHAATSGRYDVCGVLLQRLHSTDDIDAVDAAGTTPLHRASIGQHVPIVALLLERTKAIDLPARVDGNTALHYAAYSGNEPLVQLLLSYGPNRSIRNVWQHPTDSLTH
jgi:ankyrin repeat protein